MQTRRLKFVRAVVGLILAGGFLRAASQKVYASEPPPEAAIQPQLLSKCNETGTQASGAVYLLCMPNAPLFPWNGSVLLYAHGYVAANQPIGISDDLLRLPDGTYLPDAAALLGYAFATTSYSTNGLAVREGFADVVDLAAIFKAAHPTVQKIYLVGASEGGLITTLAVEQYPPTFSGGLALCGPIGDFREQINYWGDFRVAFDYFFPGLMLGSSPISITQTLMDNWDAHYANVILPAILAPANALTVTQLLSVTRAAYDPADPTTISITVYSVLWYNVFATNDGVAKLGGQPFDNQTRVYTGSLNDTLLNQTVPRFSADSSALNQIEAYYQTGARPLVPLVTQHTRLDQTVPYWQAEAYRARVVNNGWAPRHDHLPVERYGHCNFSSDDITQSLNLLVSRVANPPRFLRFLPLMGR
jgi:pimeloyl-ACP methyl ester carboxylesterase